MLSLGRSLCRRWSSGAANARIASVLSELGLSGSEVNAGCFDGQWGGTGETFTSVNPATNTVIGKTRGATIDEYDTAMNKMDSVRAEWADVPAPVRGEVVRRIGTELRRKREALGTLISLEMGKILAEGIGEVQEAIDMCDFACGLSRMLHGSVMPSERPKHFMMERYLPLKGNVAIISAFNFPVAVFFWNACLSLVAGNTHIWKPADTVTLCGVASAKIIADVLEDMKFPGVIASFACGTGSTIGSAMVNDPRNALVSFTGSTKVGQSVGTAVASRFGRSILELGGNNAIIVMDDADMALALNAAVFSSVGTAGQRCTTLRRLIIHSDVYDEFTTRLVSALKNVKIGDPLETDTLCGPLHNPAALKAFLQGISDIQAAGGRILLGGKQHGPSKPDNLFVEPTLVEVDPSAECVRREVFAPILYLFRVNNLTEAIEVNNSVPQGLSSSLFTRDMRNLFQWAGPNGSDCGIVNVNIGTSGAEIGGAFGGDKETGGGRESGSDAWKQYCRRVTCTINHSNALPLSQGIVFAAP
ncbi:hypothetical protein PBRA_004682 [Plasmodiophora brassicae]|uniref:aldehyde dehydrogenase (NAD(+)) n=1 Tax=Plasmodiophora brassicae TaxID=37360 RepID=A0A0G4ILJ4_PLABS|nr:hypothetical protein PBRA_004682 [Plasmodiophora brassicae]